MRVGIVGAGVAGLATAKVLLQAGHDVVVVDKAPDVGGVWSVTRRYPGLTTQSPSAQYSLSDFPMPRGFPEWPTGAQVQEYLVSYAEHFGVLDTVRLSTEVLTVDQDADGWTMSLRDSAGALSREKVDHLVVANGIFSEPHVPDYLGRDEFEACGGRLVAATSVHEVEQARDRHVVVVGYGKTACDVTVPLSQVAASTDIVARHLLWKVPRRIAGRVNFKMLLLTRMGEALFPYIRQRGVERFLNGPADPMRRNMLNSIGSVSVKQFKLDELDLVPPGQMEDIVKGAIGLATEGFFEGVADGSITVHKNQTVRRLGSSDAGPIAELADGTVLPADLVVCATGFTQQVPFLDEDLQEQLFDERGNFMLYRQVLPLTIPRLHFNGYNSSFFSPLNAEMAALWIAADLDGAIERPDPATMRAAVVDQLAFMDEATSTHHCRGTKIIPFSLHNLDEVLGDLHVNIAAPVRASHWLNPVDPHAYRGLTPRVLGTLRDPRSAAAVAEVADPPPALQQSSGGGTERQEVREAG